MCMVSIEGCESPVDTDTLLNYTLNLKVERLLGITFTQCAVSGKTNEIPISTELLKAFDVRAWELLKNRLDKTWSLVDCASFVVMYSDSPPLKAASQNTKHIHHNP